MNNDDLVVLGIISILTLILLFKKHKKKQSNLKVAGFTNKIKKKVRINPVPIFSPMMGNRDKFYENIIDKKTEKALVILCYANWCEQCKTLKPIFKELINNQPYKNVNFAMVEEQEKNQYSHYFKNIEGYPTIYFVNRNNEKIEYNGARDKKSILDFVKNNLK
jgi:thiol-disulfide isomerase/thioredoxin